MSRVTVGWTIERNGKEFDVDATVELCEGAAGTWEDPPEPGYAWVIACLDSNGGEWDLTEDEEKTIEELAWEQFEQEIERGIEEEYEAKREMMAMGY